MASDRDRLDRFRREARAVAALNHPNIVTLYSVEEAEGRHFLTMELVEGTTLAARVPAGGMPARDLFDLALQIADALRAAHERGITHRDLKPANMWARFPIAEHQSQSKRHRGALLFAMKDQILRTWSGETLARASKSRS
jgi:serine/threonine protein kinase